MFRAGLFAALAVAFATLVPSGGAGDGRRPVVSFNGAAGGPVLSGGRVVWSAGYPHEISVNLERAGQPRRAWRAPEIAIPEEVTTPWPGRTATLREWVDLAASRQKVAIIHFGSATLIAACAGQPIPCPNRELYATFLGELLVGPPSGPFRVAAGSHEVPCSARRVVTSVDVSGRLVAFTDTPPRACTSVTPSLWTLLPPATRVVVLGSGRRIEIPARPGTTIAGVRLEWPFAAWVEVAPRVETLVVYDVRSRRVRHRVPLGNAWLSRGFDIGSDGTAVVLLDAPACAVGHTVAWTSLREPRLHILRRRITADDAVVMSGRRFAIKRAAACTSRQQMLEVSDIRGGRRVHRYSSAGNEVIGDFDLEANRLAWSSRRIRPETDPPSWGPTVIYVAPA